MNTDKRHKSKIPVNKLPGPVEWMLKNATLQQLQYMRAQAASVNFQIFVNLISRFKDYNVYEVFRYMAKDDKDLALFRAAKRGELAGLDAYIMVCQMAGDEIARRKKIKEIL